MEVVVVDMEVVVVEVTIGLVEEAVVGVVEVAVLVDVKANNLLFEVINLPLLNVFHTNINQYMMFRKCREI